MSAAEGRPTTDNRRLGFGVWEGELATPPHAVRANGSLSAAPSSTSGEGAPGAKGIAGDDPRVEIQRRLGRVGNYNRWIFEQVEPYLGQRILDVGCALGNITRFYHDRERVIGVDIAPEFGELFRRRFAHLPQYSFLLADFAHVDPASLRHERLDTVVCLNVLEHLKDDVAALRTMYEVLVPGGRLALLVPAYRALYGTMDAADHHYRRYATGEVRRKLTGAGFVVERVWHMNAPGMLAWFLNGKVLRRALASDGQYGAYNALVPLIRAVERVVPPPVGLSLLAVGRKVADGS